MKTTASPDARLSAAIEAARKAPEREGHWNEVEHLAAALQKPEEVAALYREVLAKSLPASDKTKLGLRALRFHDEWFGGEDSPELLELLRWLLEASPAEETALSRISVALTVGGRWDELLGVYDRAIAATEGARRMRLLDEALQVAKDFAAEPDRAIGYLQQLLPLRAGDALLADALERLLERQQRWADLIELWKSRAAGASPREAQATSERVAEYWLEKLADPAAALREIEPLLPAAADGARALSIVERVLAREKAPVDARMKALGLLRDRFQQRGRPEQVVRVLEAALEFADPRAEAELRRDLAERLPALGRELDAMAHLAALLENTPGDERARAALRSLAERTGERQRYVAALLAAAEAAAAPERSALLVDAAEARAAEPGDAAGAIELLSRVLADQATPRETALAVARRLSELLGREDRRAELCGVLEKLVELEPEVLIQRDALRRAATLAQKLGETDRSIASWRALLARAPEDLEAIDSLGELLAEEQRWPALVELLRKRREVPSARRDRRADLVRIAKVSAERLADLAAATQAWTELADEFGEDGEVVDALHELYQKQERWSDLGALLTRADARETAHLTDLLVSLADARRSHLGDPEGAVAAYRRALERDPRDERSLAGLRALLEGPTRAEAVDALAAAYTTAREATALDELLEVRLSLRATDAEKVRLLREHAASAEARSNPGGALASLARALPMSPHDVQLERDVLRLAGAARSAGAEATPGETAARAKAAAAFREAAVAAEGAGAILRAGALYRTAGDLDEKRNALPEAFANYRDAARVVPEAVVTATALTRVGARAGRWQDVARVIVASAAARHQVEEALLADVEVVADADPRGEAWTAATAAFEQALSAADQLPDGVGYLIEARVAVWHDARRSDLEAAEAAWERALARDPQRREALEALVDVRRRMHDAHADAPRARALVEALCRLADRRRRDLDPIREAADLASGGEGSGAGAQAILRRTFDDASRAWRAGERAEGAHQPQETAIWALERLVESLSQAGGHAAALDTLVEASHLPVEPSLANEYLHRAAAIAEERLADSGRAIELYRNVLRRAPDDARAMERLGTILEREQRLPELLALRRHEVGLTKGVERRLSLRLAIARVVGSIEERGGRVEALRQNLEEAPGHEASIDEICGVLDAKGRHEELVNLLTEQARRVEGAPRASRPPEAAVRAGNLWGRVARLAEVALSDDERALEAHRRVVALAPTAEALDALARLHEARAEHAAAARWLERRLEGAAAEERVEVALRLSRAHVAAGQHGRAITWLERTLPRHPEATELRMLLAELYRGAEAWAPLAKLLYEGCPYAHGDELLAIVREAAELYHDRLGTPERAIPLLEQAVKLVPDDRWVRLTLADGLRVVERYDEARELLEGVITDFGRRRSPERAAVHLELARVLRAQGRLGEALAQLDLASSMKVGDPEVLATLGDVAREAGQLDRAEQAYRTLLLIVRRSQDASLDAIGASEVLYALSRICVGQGHPDQAAELSDSALATAAASALEARRFRRAALAAGEPELAVRALQLRLGAESDPHAKAELQSTLAELFEGPLDRKEDALQARLDALDGAPESLALHTATRALARVLGRTDDYVERVTELVEARRRAEEGQVVSVLQLRLGEAVEQDQGDLARASEIYGRVEAMRHHAVEAKKALARVAGMRGVSADERRRLEEIVALEGAPADAKVDALYRLADIDVVGPENRARGLAALEDALERDPQYARAARTLREAAEGAPDDADLWALYERVSRVSGDDGLLLEYLERRARHPAVTLEELRDAVTLAGRSGTSDREQALLERTVERAREHPRGLQEALWAPEALAERARQADDRAGAIRWLCEAAAATEGDVHKQLVLRAAALAGESPDALRTAAELYEQLLEHGETGREVWEPLLEVYRRAGDAARLLALCTSTLETLPTSADRNALRNNQAEWLLERGPGDLKERRQGAIALLRDVMAEVPDDPEAAAKLAALYGQAGEVDALAELLSRQLDHARDRQDASAAVEVSLRLAGVLQKSRPEDAKDALRAALEWAPQDRGVLTRLLELLRGNDDARERAERMEQLLAIESGAAAAKLAKKVATAWQELDEPAGVQRALEAGYRGASADKEIRQRLDRWYREREDWGSLAGFLVRDAARQEAAADALSRYREAATLYQQRLDDPASAAEALRRAVEQSPHEIELVRELCAMRAADGDPRLGVEDVGAALARLDGDDPRALELYKLRADLLTDLGREDQALGDLEKAFAIGGVAEAPSLVAALQRRRDRAGRGGDLSAERAATMRLVEVLVGAADTEGARDALIGWVAADPTDRDAIRALRDMDDAAGRWAEVAESCRRLIGLEVGSERVDAALRLADACVRAGDPAAARAGLEQAYAADPSATLRNQLRKLYETTGAHRERAEMILADAEGVGDDSGRFTLLMQAADLLLNRANDPAEALAPLRSAVALKPDDPDAMLLLVDACIAGGLLEEATKRLDAAISAMGRRRTPELALLQHRMARVAQAYGDTRRQRDWLIASVDTDRNNGEAAADLADLSMQLGDHDTALKALRLVTLLKTPCRMSRAVAFLRQAQIAHHQGDGQKALVFARRARAEDAQLAEASDFLRQLGDA